ncbi:hypothetical protein [Pararhizobium sp. LjRoot238]|uniref:hypothetical protein n=1 Tax=Pararhizobium sp. LjRoot238 TaxID=3342293 RepID=UPI003F50416B
MMPKTVAKKLAADPNVGTEELEAAVDYMTEKLIEAALRNAPAPFLTYRNKMIFETTLKIRQRR